MEWLIIYDFMLFPKLPEFASYCLLYSLSKMKLLNAILENMSLFTHILQPKKYAYMSFNSAKDFCVSFLVHQAST
jgi:hypothetical protein